MVGIGFKGSLTAGTVAASVLASTPWASGQVLRLVADLAPGAQSSSPREVAILGTRLVFVADGPEWATGLYITDGSAAGTSLLLAQGVRSVTSSGGKVFFVSDKNGADQMWVTDGTPAGTFVPREFEGTYGVGPVARYLNGVVFTQHFGPSGPIICFSDGTAAGTRTIGGSPEGYMHDAVEFKGRLYFGLNGGYYVGDEVHVATPTSVRIFRDTDFMAPGAQPTHLTAADPYLYFAGSWIGIGRELWRSDGTAQGTVPFVDLIPGPASGNPFALTWINARLWFAARRDGSDIDYFVTDGSAAGTVPVVTTDTPTDAPAAILGLRAYRIATRVDGRGVVWVSDGTVANTRRFAPTDGVPGFNATAVAAGAGRLIVTAVTPETGQELWVWDPARGDVYLAPEPAPGVTSSKPSLVTGIAQRVYFAAISPDAGGELFVLDFCPADLDRDGSVGPADHALFLALYESGDERADIDGSGFVDHDDFDAFVSALEKGCG